MSAGQFTLRFYEADSGDIHLMKQQPETAGLTIAGTANVAISGPATSEFWAETNRGAKEYGLRPRKLRGRFNPGQAPDGYKEGATFDVVIYNPAVYNGATIGAVCEYLGGSGLIVSKIAENIYPGI